MGGTDRQSGEMRWAMFLAVALYKRWMHLLSNYALATFYSCFSRMSPAARPLTSPAAYHAQCHRGGQALRNPFLPLSQR